MRGGQQRNADDHVRGRAKKIADMQFLKRLTQDINR